MKKKIYARVDSPSYFQHGDLPRGRTELVSATVTPNQVSNGGRQ